MVKMIQASLMVLCSLGLAACAGPQLFPDQAMQDVQVSFNYDTWRQATNGNTGLKVQLGGRIVQAEQQNGGVLIVAEQLPIVKHPAYGPTDTIKRTGEFEFAFLYPGQLEPSALTTGNRIILVGTTTGQKHVVVRGSPKSEPYLVASCVHVWKTEGREIADFPTVGAGYSPLEERTYCASDKKK